MTRMAFSTYALAEKIPPGDPIWRPFNASFECVDVPTIEIANYIYTGHPFTTWHKNNWRVTENYWLGQHLGLDFDTEDQRSTLAYLVKDKFVAKYASLVYTTPSHTPDKPRARVLFTLDTPIYQAANYTMAAAALLWLFSAADPKAKDAVRFFYGAVHCDVEYLDNTLPLDVVKSLISRYRETAAQTRRKQDYESTGDVDAGRLVDSIIAKAADGERNSLGFWLACTLAESGLSRSETERHMRRYQAAVTHLSRDPYTEHEALASAASAYRKVAAA